jgi:iron complex transport system ATP-binding protein
MSELLLSKLSAGYGSRLILHSVSLNVRGGELLALVGPNGAGKSTLIRVVSGVTPARAGEVLLDGANLLRSSPARRARSIAVVPQLIHLPDAFTVGEIVMLGRTPHLPLWGGEGRKDCEIAWRAMRHTHIEALIDRRVDELSGGEQQRVVIARALTQEPRVLLLDEPTAHLDLKHQIAVLELIKSLAHEHGLAVLLTLHDLNLAALYADRIALMEEGRVVAQGAVGEVLTADRLSAVYGVPVAVSKHPVHGTPLIAPVSKNFYQTK